jgi:Streptomyces sporulation and cell division protein, SsgA
MGDPTARPAAVRLRTRPPPPWSRSVTTAAPLTRALRLQQVVAGSDTLPVDAELSFDPADPYAVTATFHAEPETADAPSVVWTFARELLADGLDQPAGQGDIGVWPSTSRGLPVVCLALRSPSGHALLEASVADVEAFLAASYTLVPMGEESAHCDLEATFARLLAG